MLKRGGKVRAGVIENRKGKTLQPIIREQVEPLHLQAYIAEQVFRSNNRKDMNDGARFVDVLSQIVATALPMRS